jgi:hypothetical protein
MSHQPVLELEVPLDVKKWDKETECTVLSNTYRCTEADIGAQQYLI